MTFLVIAYLVGYAVTVFAVGRELGGRLPGMTLWLLLLLWLPFVLSRAHSELQFRRRFWGR